MLDKIIRTAKNFEKELTFEIGSNSDLILENTITNNLVWTIENFKSTKKEAFPNSINLYNKEIMKGSGRGKYRYKEEIKKDGEIFLREQMNKYFPNNKIEYIV